MVESYGSMKVASTNVLKFSGNKRSDVDIDEVYPRIFMSGFSAAENYSALRKCGITHVLSVSPAS